jgi:16S rRNA (guanine527-N7)-methyltransferase
MELILKYFPDLNDIQKEQFAMICELYRYWNERINVISRKDIDNLYEHHVLHSLAIAKTISFKNGTKIIDVGTGGGFPGIPLAILFPECDFLLIDSIGKKIRVGIEVSKAINLNNIELKHVRIQEEKQKADFVVSRAVMPLTDLFKLSSKNILKDDKNALPNGIICLKGGELQHEIMPFKNRTSVFEISEFFKEEFFKTKKVVYVPV